MITYQILQSQSAKEEKGKERKRKRRKEGNRIKEGTHKGDSSSFHS
jgi:hypothetical protein